ncbi:MAG: metallophosphoesterase, partial [Gammaproteobacteria bacterium]|nr:metallophosphoesterase [Gammaproteobacteria bacterium]
DRLGYRCDNGVYRHSERQIIFLGDFIDRGPEQREVIEIVRPMIDAGAAQAVMGNHEFNAICYFTQDPEDPSRHLRVHSAKNQAQHKVFLEAYDGTRDYAELINWFRTLPLWLDLDGLRVIHACWDEKLMRFLSDRYPTVNSFLADDLIVKASRRDSKEFKAVETLLKGKEIRMPGDTMFRDKDGNPRHHIRIRWWDGKARTYQAAFLGPDAALSHIPEDPIDAEHLIDYSEGDPPVFFGHYWLDGEIDRLAPNIACLDYSVAAKVGGKLVAYRWDGEQQLSKDKFVHVSR